MDFHLEIDVLNHLTFQLKQPLKHNFVAKVGEVKKNISGCCCWILKTFKSSNPNNIDVLIEWHTVHV